LDKRKILSDEKLEKVAGGGMFFVDDKDGGRTVFKCDVCQKEVPRSSLKQTGGCFEREINGSVMHVMEKDTDRCPECYETYKKK